MEEIITDLRLHPALLNELCSGRKYREASLRAREKACAQEAAAARGHKTIPGLGKMVMSIPEDEYYDMCFKYGYEAFDDRGFIRDMQRLEPDLACHKV
jgi:hypothetical protein